jgi:hypothetical protein
MRTTKQNLCHTISARIKSCLKSFHRVSFLGLKGTGVNISDNAESGTELGVAPNGLAEDLQRDRLRYDVAFARRLFQCSRPHHRRSALHQASEAPGLWKTRANGHDLSRYPR